MEGPQQASNSPGAPVSLLRPRFPQTSVPHPCAALRERDWRMGGKATNLRRRLRFPAISQSARKGRARSAGASTREKLPVSHPFAGFLANGWESNEPWQAFAVSRHFAKCAKRTGHGALAPARAKNFPCPILLPAFWQMGGRATNPGRHLRFPAISQSARKGRGTERWRQDARKTSRVHPFAGSLANGWEPQISPRARGSFLPDRPHRLPQAGLPSVPPNYREFAYVTNGGSATVTVLDVVNIRVDREIPVGQNPIAVAASPPKRSLRREFRRGEWGGSLSVIDAEKNAVVATIALHRGPRLSIWTHPAPGLHRQHRLQHHLRCRPQGPPGDRADRHGRRACRCPHRAGRSDPRRRQPSR